MTHSIHATPVKPRYAVCGPTSGPNGEKPYWVIIDSQASRSKIVEYVQGKDAALEKCRQMNEGE